MIPGKKDAKMIDERKSVNGRRIYYGWLIVLVTFLSSMISAGLTGYGLAFFIIPMSMALNVSRAAFSAVTLFRLAALPLIPFLGILVDKRHGARILMTVGSIVAGWLAVLVFAGPTNGGTCNTNNATSNTRSSRCYSIGLINDHDTPFDTFTCCC